MSDKEVTSVSKLKSLVEALDLLTEDENWTPNVKQWKRIKSMIETLEEPEYPPARQQSAARPAPRSVTARPAPGGVNPLEHGNINFPEVPSAIPSDAPRAPSRGGSSLLQPGAGPQRSQQPTGVPVDEVPEKPPTSPEP